MALAVGVVSLGAPRAARAAAPEDEITPAHSKLILEYWAKRCADFKPEDCLPGGVDPEKGKLKVLESDRDKRTEDLKKLESQTVKDLLEPGPLRNYSQYLKKCQPAQPLKYKVDIALYKTQRNMNDLLQEVTHKIWGECEPGVTGTNPKLMKKIKVVHFKLVPPKDTGDDDVSYDFDEDSGVLTVGAFAQGAFADSKNWKQLIKNN
jgi:hypothetical protein